MGITSVEAAVTASTGARADRHIAPLDGLRGAAVAAVLLFHSGHLSGGFLGVDLFFALSGYLITSLLVAEIERTDHLDLVRFWGRRLRRLMPAALAMLATVTLVAWAIGDPASLDATLRDGPSSQVSLANWHLISQSSGYWASFSAASPFTHMWSLSVEEQVYLMWPLVIAAVWRVRRSTATVAGVAAGLLIASVGAMLVLLDPTDPTRVYMGTDTRAASVLAGALLALPPLRPLARRVARARPALTDAALCAVVIVLGAMWLHVDGVSTPWLFRGGLLVHSALAAVLVALVAEHRVGFVGRLLAWRPLVALGTVSYGLYLWHWPIYRLIAPPAGEPASWALTGGRVAASVAVAIVSFRLIEQPVRRAPQWSHGRRGMAAWGGAMLVVASLWVVVPRPVSEIAAIDTDRLAPQIGTPATSTSAPAPDRTGSGADPATVPGTVASTSTTTLPRPVVRSVLWMGDSVAHDLAPAVLAALTAAGVAVTSVAEPGFRLGPLEDASAWEHAADLLADHPVDLVVMQLSLWDTELSTDEQRTVLERLVFSVRSTGAALVLVPLPVLRADQAKPGAPGLVEVAASLVATDPTHLFLLADSGPWGEEYRQDLDGDGIPERKDDGVHVCPSGAAMYASWLLQQLTSRVDGVTPSADASWLAGEWSRDQRYAEPVGACDRVD